MDSNSEFIKKHGNAISKMYLKESKSTYEIAQEFNTYPNKIRRTLKTLGVSLRDKSKAQTVAIKNGRHEHPTRGKKRSESEKIAISNGMSKFWNDMEEEERARRCEISRKQWASMSDEQRELLRKSATEAVLKASKEGSKIMKINYLDERVSQVEAGKWLQTTFIDYVEKPFEEYDINYDYYISKAKKEIESLEPNTNQLQLF